MVQDYLELRDMLGAAPQYDLEELDRAYRMAERCHEGQLRYSGEPYITHPVAVAKILAKLGMDQQSILVAILHDTVEDTDATLEDIRKEFGGETARLVDGLTKLGKVPLSTREEQQAENIRKMLMAMNEDVRVIIVKLADRLHNMRTLHYRKEQKRRDTSLETLEIYAPIAHRLGIRAIKEELEDLAISHLDPVAYKEIEESLSLRAEERNAFLTEIKERIRARISPTIKEAQIDGRVKSVHGIYRKVYMRNKNFDEIYDIYAVRIIVDELVDCYNCLGIIHDMFRPLPGRFKDYISTPKPNMYQSLHTTVIGKEGIPFEVQIRTWEMHRTAEFGIAAHWKYKLGMKDKDQPDARLNWVRQIIENQTEDGSPEELVSTIKTDLALEDVFVFTPKGDVISLPVGSTVIDFAYAIHSAVGNRMSGAKVDGRIVSLDYEVKTGEIVEVITSSQQGKGPSRDWLKMVKTSEARTKIRSWYKKERREENIIEGRAEFEREMKRNSIRLTQEQMGEFVDKIAERQHCRSSEDFFAAGGYGGIVVSRLIPYIKEEYNKTYRAKEPVLPPLVKEDRKVKSNEGVVVEGIDNCLIKFAKCCNPLPGDEIIGFITRGHGLSIHQRGCNNVPGDLENCEEPDRWVAARWDDTVKVEFKSTLSVFAVDREALLADLTVELANMHVKVHTLNLRQIGDGNCITTITVTVNGTEHLKSVVAKISKIEGIISIERSGL
ncbi:MAG: bifunctional (p)ppGpp synthetase/guanosine-3',5'-bis(diphosphate) 3'-pyrophosphohydrolase [Clostridiales bacterium]|nr:bifunctional (p)ppGpp synthetase/guanosine-3',5'-bis(diphosphate) 3'-pyrophosphohydrolase [Clostridiales bacterium]